MYKWTFVILGLLAFSCTKEYGYEVDNEVLPFFEIFELEGLERGINVDLDTEGIGATIDFIRDNSTVGQCQTSDQGNRRIFIDQAFWEGYSFSEKEFIIFHELGHCFLKREHDNSIKGNNVCSSIMQSGVSGCRNQYNETTREEYLDELFSN